MTDPVVHRKTKIVCTLGPATDSSDGITALINAGMDVVRLNFSHGSRDDHRATIRRVREAARAAGREVGILQDLGGLARTAWETVVELMCAAVGDEELRPGIVAVVQTAGDLANWHPHAHGLVSRGGLGNDGPDAVGRPPT